MAPERTLFLAHTVIPLSCLVAGLLLFHITPDFCGRYSEWFFLLSIPLFGIPHGSADLLLAEKHHHLRRWSRSWLIYFTGYALLVAACIGFALAFPVITGALFILLTAWHWGHGDECSQKNPNLLQRVRACCKGLVVMSGSIYAAPEITLHMLRLNSEPTTALRLAEFNQIILIIAALVYLGLLRWQRELLQSSLKAIELALVILLFTSAPVFYALALYFMVVHSWRHLVSLSDYLSPIARLSDLTRKVWDLHLQLIPVTLLACLIITATFLITKHLTLAGTLNQIYFSCLLGLTIPHVILWESWQNRA